MRILIVNPAYGKNFVRSARWAARSRGRVQRHPDYLAIATAVLEKEGHEVKLLDAAALNMDQGAVREIAVTFRPELSVVHTTTPSIYSDIRHGEMLKEVGAVTVLIGQHCSALPVETMKISGHIDFVVQGEYDYALRDLASGTPVTEIEGLAFREGEQIVWNHRRSFITNLDELPFPAWHQIDIRDYFDAGKLYPFVTLISGRGCPNGCTFCVLPQVLYGRKYRLRSASSVVDEIQYDLELFPELKEVMFEDDTLTARPERTGEICEEILNRGIRISWSANSRADLDDLDLLKLMKEAGCRMLVVGFEFGDQCVLDNVNKRLTVEQMKQFTALARKAHIKIHGCFMVGGPGETKETAERTIRLAQELKPDTVQFSALTPYPGTELYDWCRVKGYILAADWPEWVTAGEQQTVLEYPGLSRTDILELVDRGLYHGFYLRPRTWVHHLLTVTSFDDFKRKMRGAKNLLQYLWSKNLPPSGQI